jgi:tripartite-type tricarboxylate transporter receptor subunit TctC
MCLANCSGVTLIGSAPSAARRFLVSVSESGVPGYEANNWWGVMAPAGVPDAVVRKLNAESNIVMSLPDTKKRLAAEGAEPINVTPEQFAKHIAAEIVKWGKVTKEANIKAE